MSTLWAIKGRLFELAEVRRQTVELDPNSQWGLSEEEKLESLAVIDQQIREYITEEVSKNPDSIHQYILESSARQAALKIEQRRIDGLLAAEEGNEARAKQLTLEVMNILGVKALPVQGTLRRQNNGGVQAVEVTQPELVPMNFQRITVTLPYDSWLGAVIFEVDVNDPRVKVGTPEPDLTAIREQLQKREPCPKCFSVGRTHLSEMAGDGPGQTVPCSNCGGEGTIPCGVPGARLADRGEHLRCS